MSVELRGFKMDFVWRNINWSLYDTLHASCLVQGVSMQLFMKELSHVKHKNALFSFSM